MDNNPKPIVAAPAISYRSIGSAVSIRWRPRSVQQDLAVWALSASPW